MNNHIEQSGQHRFVVLRLTGQDGGKARGATLLVVEDGGSLRIYMEKHWDSALKTNEREYLNGLLQDWRSATGDVARATLDELAELSVGPLRTVESGVADAEKLAGLVRIFEA